MKRFFSLIIGCCMMAFIGATAQTENLSVSTAYVVSGELHLGDMTFELNAGEKTPGVTLDADEVHPAVFTHGHIIVKHNINAQQAMEQSTYWFAFPIEMTANTADYGTRWTAESYQNGTWTMLKPTEGQIRFHAGQGYRIHYHAIADNYTLIFTSLHNNFASNDCRTTGTQVTYATINGTDAEHSNLQLVGQPFLSEARINTTNVRVALPTPNGSLEQYISNDPAIPTIEPFHAYFVQNNNTVTYKGLKNSTLKMDPIAAHTVNDEFLTLTLSQNNVRNDRTVIWLSEDGTPGYDATEDYSKLFLDNGTAARLYTQNNGIKLAYNRMPFMESVIPVGVQTSTQGTYTFALDNRYTSAANVILHDKMLKRYTDLKTNTYTVKLDKEAINDRFELNISFIPKTTPKIENPNGTDNLNVYTSNRGIVVENVPVGASIQLLDATGRMITTRQNVEQTLTLPQLIPGMYMLMVQSDGREDGHKLIVR